MTTPRDPSRLLRNSLRANAAFSLASGATFVVASEPLARFFGLPEAAAVSGLGLNLLVFAALLLLLAAPRAIRLWLAATVVAADLAWVLGSVGVILTGPLSTPGNGAVAAIACVVLLFAALQYAGIRRLQSLQAVPAAAI